MKSDQEISSQDHTKTDGKSKIFSKDRIIILVIVLIVSITTLVARENLIYESTNIGTNSDYENDSSPRAKEDKQWISCTDIRDVIEEDERLYIACFGGVLIYDTSTSKIVDQISMADGLSNFTTTSLAKKGDMLYIGTQAGVTMYNLTTKKTSILNTTNGLVNDRNIELALDGDTLWIGTFNGISQYDTNSGAIENLTASSVYWANSFSASNLHITDRGVFFLSPAHSESQGGVLRYDKTTKQWSTYSLVDFGLPDRIDLFNLVDVGGVIYVSDGSMVWRGQDSPSMEWERVTDLEENLATNNVYSSRIFAGHTNQNNLVLIDETLREYDSGSTAIVPYTFSDDTQSVSIQGSILKLRDNLVWQRGAGDIWLSVVDFNQESIRTYPQDHTRELSFNGIPFLINSNPVVYSESSIKEYHPSSDTFAQVSSFHAESQQNILLQEPIPFTPYIIYVEHVCGHGCLNPEIYIVNYADGNVTPIELPFEIQNIELVWQDSEQGMFGFKIDARNQYEYLLLDGASKSVELLPSVPSEAVVSEKNNVVCNKNYEYDIQKQQFLPLSCISEAGNEKFTYDIDDKNLWKVDRSTQQREIVDLPNSGNDYKIYKGVLDGEALWLATNNGIIRFDITSERMTRISANDGLVGNDIAEVHIGDQYIWSASGFYESIIGISRLAL